MHVESILDVIGNTPLVQIHSITDNPKIKVFAKLEGQNPGGSVKDRAVYGMIDAAMKRGDIKEGSHLVEATSGNTGIGLAMISRQFGLDLTIVMPDGATQERIDMMKAYGANVILVPADDGIEFAREQANLLAKEHGYFQLDQFANIDNWRSHYRTTGPELWRGTNGKITHFISAMGTTGTIMGVSRYLKAKDSDIQIIGVEPSDGTHIPGIRRWAPSFVPAIFDPHRLDRVIEVNREEAISSMKDMALKESILVGISSGGAMAATKKLLQELESGTVVFLCPDRGDRYLSMGLFL